MLAVVEAIISAGISENTKARNSTTVGYTHLLIMSTNAEGYAQACLALASAIDPDYSKISSPTLIIAGAEDETSPATTVDSLQSALPHCKSVKLQDVVHWHALEDVEAVARLLEGFSN